MVITALDTHAMVKDLTAAGFNIQQAEGLTKALRVSQDVDLSNLATKQDMQLSLAAMKSDLEMGLALVRSDLEKGLAAVRSGLEKGLASARSDLEKGLAETRADIIKWTIGAIGLQAFAILGGAIALVHVIGH